MTKNRNNKSKNKFAGAPSGKKNKGHSKRSQPISEQLLLMLDTNPTQSFSIRQITKRLGLKDANSKKELPKILHKLEKEGRINQGSRHRYQTMLEPNFIIGKVDFVNPRFGYVVTDDMEDDIWIHGRDMRYALDGDIVKVMLLSGKKRGKNPEGEVVEIIQRSKKEFVGRIEMSARYAFVLPDNKKMHYDIFVYPEDYKGAQHNEKVIVEITEWPAHDKKPEGKVTRVLGKAGENEAEIHSIMAEFELPFEFPEKVEKQADSISEEITKDEIKKRKDIRDILTITIDPHDAKDFDDAISLQKLKNGNYEVGVHIADVTHYVKPGTILEQEAYKRATSVYLVDRTIPMLPERLSNGLCSLRPNEDKLTFSAIFEINSEAKVIKEWFGKTIMHSDRRFTYEEAQEGIESGKGDFAEELKIVNDLAKKLRNQRFEMGAMNFETTEVKFKLAENGKPLGVIPKVRKDAHKLVEEFMLLANKKVAEFVFKMKSGKVKNTFVYRTHDYPDPERVNAFSLFAQKFGHKLNVDEGAISKSINKLIDDIEGRPEQNVLQSLAIRTMSKAKYTTEASGHFGLAFDHYSHFTSPIRRYPDVMVHRLLQHYLDQGKSVNKDDYEDKCRHSSDMEKRAADAERASIKYKQVEFMQSVEDKVFNGIVTGVTEWGIFVEITETKCEGLVRMADLTDDYYEFDEKNYRVIGKRNKKMITLGDQVKVTVKATDIDRRTIDLEFAND